MKGKILFQEKQRFHQGFMGVIITLGGIAVLAPIYYTLFKQVVLDEPNDTSTMTDNELIILTAIVTVFVIGIHFFVHLHELEMKIDRNTIQYRFFPYFNSYKVRNQAEIKEAYVRKYSPIFEYGGWGLRFGFGKGKAYNIRGNWGLQLIFKDGKKLLIGTQKPKELDRIMKNWME